MIELHFNWIFVLIAGAVIFLFFMNIVDKQRAFSEKKTSATIITSLESILTGAKVSTGTVNIVDMPQTEITFECDKYSIGDIPKQTKVDVIFSPNLLKGKKLITWALDWNVPYRVTNFLYLTDPQIRYIIVNNTNNIGHKIDEELPKEMNKEVISTTTIVLDKNNYKVKFIFLGNANNNVLNDLQKMPDKDVTAINITDIGTSTVIPNTGKINFLQKNGNKWEIKSTTYYLKKESLFGAIFAEDIEMYNCVMKKAFKKLNLVTTIYLERSKELKNYYLSTNNYNCETLAHNKAVMSLEFMKDASERQANNFPPIRPSDITMQSMQDYSNEIGVEQSSANNLAQLYSCALIY